MKFRFIIGLLCLSTLFSCKKEELSSSVTATVNGNSWLSDNIKTDVNSSGDLTYIEAIASDFTRLIFKMDETLLSVPSNELPVYTAGVPVISTVNFQATPSINSIDYEFTIANLSTDFIKAEVEISEDQNNFVPLTGSELNVTSNSLSINWSTANQRNTNSAFLLYRISVEYGNNQVWHSDVAIGTTSFRAQYDSSATLGQETGNFSVGTYDKTSKNLSASFDFTTVNDVISGGQIELKGY